MVLRFLTNADNAQTLVSQNCTKMISAQILQKIQVPELTGIVGDDISTWKALLLDFRTCAAKPGDILQSGPRCRILQILSQNNRPPRNDRDRGIELTASKAGEL